MALVTGEERIVPPRTQYWVCTVEAMPEGMGADFVAIDEIQLCADPERGHVFTDRLLRARGLHETVFLGADTMRGTIAQLVPGVEFITLVATTVLPAPVGSTAQTLLLPACHDLKTPCTASDWYGRRLIIKRPRFHDTFDLFGYSLTRWLVFVMPLNPMI